MDIALLKTFLEVSRTGSFGGAAERLFVTQSAVSLRIQRLEDQIGRPLFTRSKAGADLTPAGRAFEGYAQSMIQTWEMARQQVAVPESFTRAITLGAQYSLWPRLGFRWIDGLRARMPDLSIRAELGMPDRLTRLMVEGSMQAALMYSPTLRPGLSAERIMDEELVLVASWPGAGAEIAGCYAYVDWGPEFAAWHASHQPDLGNTGLTLALGALAADFISRRRFAAYLPACAILRHIHEGRLHPVDDAPVFPYPVWSVWRDDADPEVVDVAKSLLRDLVEGIDDEVDMLNLGHNGKAAGE